MEKIKKKFKLVDAILATICITLVAESVMPTAAIGNSQYFWWEDSSLGDSRSALPLRR
mgnify:CR=1 FL=1